MLLIEESKINSIFIDIFVIGFGKPLPLHEVWIEYLNKLDANFYIVTDEYISWENISKKTKIKVVPMSLQDYFVEIAKLLGCATCENLLIKYGDLFYNEINGWTACGFRPMFGKIFQNKIKSELWGWMDYDVFINKNFIKQLKEYSINSSRVSIFTPRGIRWEQFKVFKTQKIDEINNLFISNIKDNKYKPGTPLEVQFIYDDDDDDSRDEYYPITQNQISVHWKYLNEIGVQGKINRSNVYVNLNNCEIKSLEKNDCVALLIADEQFKTTNKKMVNEIKYTEEIAFKQNNIMKQKN